VTAQTILLGRHLTPVVRHTTLRGYPHQVQLGGGVFLNLDEATARALAAALVEHFAGDRFAVPAGEPLPDGVTGFDPHDEVVTLPAQTMPYVRPDFGDPSYRTDLRRRS
jgi:hypothetical protein